MHAHYYTPIFPKSKVERGLRGKLKSKKVLRNVFEREIATFVIYTH